MPDVRARVFASTATTLTPADPRRASTDSHELAQVRQRRLLRTVPLRSWRCHAVRGRDERFPGTQTHRYTKPKDILLGNL